MSKIDKEDKNIPVSPINKLNVEGGVDKSYGESKWKSQENNFVKAVQSPSHKVEIKNQKYGEKSSFQEQ